MLKFLPIMHLSIALKSHPLCSILCTYVTVLIRTSTEIHFLSVCESYTHALPRNTKFLTIDGQVCFHRQLFTNAVKLQGCISQPKGALIGLHRVPGCS